MDLSSAPQYPGHLDRRIPSSPAPSVSSYTDAQNDSLRPMKLKVHYTFDNENKTNHLVRWRDEIRVRTAFLDEKTQVGVIELKTCINAIVNASPELVAKLGQDYTIYAYDYSEYETPLVGQGMLSWALASSRPPAPAEQSQTMVTGRVCRTLGLFAGGAPETLEVKLRLVPVPTALQNEYVDSMDKYRRLSMLMPEGFDFQGWNDFLKANPAILSVLKSGNSSTMSEASKGDTGIEQVQRLMHHGYIPPNGQDQGPYPRSLSFSGPAGGQELFRGGSPAPSVQSFHSARGPSSRPESRQSNYPAVSIENLPSMSGPPDSGYISNDERVEEGRPRKRAKVTQASHPGKSSLGKKVDSLRVAASAAASVRVHQPSAVRPSQNPVSNLEEPPRAPTPIPQAANHQCRSRLAPFKSNLSHESFTASESGYNSPYLSPHHVPSLPNSTATSPEATQLLGLENSPEEPGSSPPMLPDNITCQSSPALPPLRPPTEPEILMSRLNDLSADEADDVDRPVPVEDVEIAKRYQPRVEYVQAPATQENAPAGKGQSSRTSKKERKVRDPRTISHENARRAVGFKRAQTWSGEATTSDPAPIPLKPARTAASNAGSPEGEGNPKSRQTKWDKDKRNAAVQKKLAKAVATGELPPFCEVCGAIETPTWRKAYSKIYSGSAAAVEISKGDGAVVCCQILETNEDGSTKLFKVFKKSLLDSDDGFSEFLACNPCGLWLVNRHKLRPENLWNNNEKRKEEKEKEKEKPKRSSRSKKPRLNNDLTSDVLGSQLDTPSDALAIPAPEESGESPLDQGNATDTEKPEEPELPPVVRPRGGSGWSDGVQSDRSPEGLLDPAAYAALAQALRSSPNRFPGSKTSPINIDQETPDPARRKLFSSPKTSGPLGIDAPSGSTPKTKAAVTARTPQQNPIVTIGAGQEMLPGRSVTPDPFPDLTKALAPVTPSKTNTNPTATKTPSDLFKTPSSRSSQAQQRISTNDFFSSAAKAFLHGGPQTPSHTPSKSNKIDQAALDQMTPFTRSLNLILSDANAQESSPSRFMGLLGDVRSLPTLTNGTNENSGPMDFDFSDFNPTSDLGLTSSPPSSRWFGLSDDATEGGIWEDVGFGSSPAKETEKGGEGQEAVAADTAA